MPTNLLTINGQSIELGQRKLLNIPVGTLTTHEPVTMRVWVIRGKRQGPTLLVTGCVHGDEINGAEIIRRLINAPALTKRFKGTLIALPIVNVPAFANRSRYLPDRRDLNRLFPGSQKGSLGGRLAHVLSHEILPHCDAVVDLHTGAINRPNLPQIRVSKTDSKAIALAEAFAPPAILEASVRDGSFRSVCNKLSIPTILYESGEALRLDAPSIRFGQRGVLSVMRYLGMLPTKSKQSTPTVSPVVAEKSHWERAEAGGLFTPLIPLGKGVKKGDVLGFIADPLGDYEKPILASRSGFLIGRTNEGQADEGDALFHIAHLRTPLKAEQSIAESGEELGEQSAPFDDDEGDTPVHYDPYNDVL